MHFKIRTKVAAGRGNEFTSQLFFDDSLSDQVFAQAPYAKKGQGRLKNNGDSIFRDGKTQDVKLKLGEQPEDMASVGHRGSSKSNKNDNASESDQANNTGNNLSQLGLRLATPTEARSGP